MQEFRQNHVGTLTWIRMSSRSTAPDQSHHIPCWLTTGSQVGFRARSFVSFITKYSMIRCQNTRNCSVRSTLIRVMIPRYISGRAEMKSVFFSSVLLLRYEVQARSPLPILGLRAKFPTLRGFSYEEAVPRICVYIYIYIYNHTRHCVHKHSDSELVVVNTLHLAVDYCSSV